MMWIPVTVAAAALQTARNAAQRSIMGAAGPWGATLVRFLFGLPFSCLFVLAAALATPGHAWTAGQWFWAACAAGAGLQILATAALLTAMQRSSFALGTAMQQSGLPFSLVWGAAFFGDRVGPFVWSGAVIAAAGLAALSWPRGPDGVRPSAAVFGLTSGAVFALSANFFRQASLAFDPSHPVFSALVSVMVVQAMQSCGLTAWLAAANRPALANVLAVWRRSLGAGFFGAAASGLWFTAMAMTPVGQVRAVGVAEMPFAALLGRRLFRERLGAFQLAMGAVTACGVVLAALG
jgi:drug/metabolite transporter (DMT)-like permease